MSLGVDTAVGAPAADRTRTKVDLLMPAARGLGLGIGVLFVWTSLSKLLQPYDFLYAIYDYDLVGRGFGLFLGRALPWGELVLGASLVLGVLQRGGLLVSVGLFTMFTVARFMAAWREVPIPCGCATPSAEPATYEDVLTSVALLLAALVALTCLLAADRHSAGLQRGRSP